MHGGKQNNIGSVEEVNERGTILLKKKKKRNYLLVLEDDFNNLMIM